MKSLSIPTRVYNLTLAATIILGIGTSKTAPVQAYALTREANSVIANLTAPPKSLQAPKFIKASKSSDRVAGFPPLVDILDSLNYYAQADSSTKAKAGNPLSVILWATLVMVILGLIFGNSGSSTPQTAAVPDPTPPAPPPGLGDFTDINLPGTDEPIDIDIDIPGSNDKPGSPVNPTPVPTPALLPSLIMLGFRALKQRRQLASAEAG
ncbi:MAG: PTPA-CTERM sorting domain-containing protein [Nodosilinea sp.]